MESFPSSCSCQRRKSTPKSIQTQYHYKQSKLVFLFLNLIIEISFLVVSIWNLISFYLSFLIFVDKITATLLIMEQRKAILSPIPSTDRNIIGSAINSLLSHSIQSQKTPKSITCDNSEEILCSKFCHVGEKYLLLM